MSNSKTSTEFLKLIPYHKFLLWDVKRYTRGQIKSDFDLVPLYKLIKEENQKFKIFEEPDKEFKILGVSNVEGLFDAYTIKGKEINQPYKKVEKGWLAYNPYRINVGSIGLRDVQNKHEYISPAYVVFSCNDKLLPDFLYKIFKTDTFNKIIRENTSGSVRQNLLFNTLETIEIPIPPKSEQQRLLNVYYEKITKAEQQEAEAKRLEDEIEDYILNKLDIKKDKKEIIKGLNLINFKNISKWGVEYNIGSGNTLTILKSIRFKNSPLGLLVEINPTTSFTNTDEKNISFLPMECISDEFGEISNQKEGFTQNSKGYTRFQEGDLLWAKITPCMENGKSAIASNLINHYGYGSTEFHVLRQKQDDFKIEFLYHLLRMKIIRNNATSYFTGSAGQQRVPKGYLEELVVPKPPLNIQIEIINHLNVSKDKIKRLKKEASINKELAIKEFEESIFNKQN
jgi:type I restriction enzyme, S subunit